MIAARASSDYQQQLEDLAVEELELRHTAERLAARKSRLLQQLQVALTAERATAEYGS